MINLRNNMGCFLTALEKKILIEFIEYKKIKRDYFLENIIKIKKNVETKTIESHLSRIRKKLLKINSLIQISSKEDVFYFEN
jgi:DNA-binding response OmpR family regulator